MNVGIGIVSASLKKNARNCAKLFLQVDGVALQKNFRQATSGPVEVKIGKKLRPFRMEARSRQEVHRGGPA